MTGAPATGRDNADAASADAVVTESNRAADGDHDKPFKRARMSADKEGEDAAARSGSARDADEEEDEEEGDTD